ncbi:MAG: hypothetical protein IPM46_11230 [Flavobacteriales bacterium]|nr:hypothetical protein [Flavobacteriales bacterium]
MRYLLVIGLLLGAAGSPAQVPVPFTTAEDRFMIFTDGRFEKMEPRPPAFIHAMQGQLVYRDHEGLLKVFLAEGRRLHLLDRNGSQPRVTPSRIAWLSADTLKTLREGRAKVVAVNMADFGVSDSLLVWHDSTAHELQVLWRARVYPVAQVDQGTERPQWSMGSDRVAFFNKETRRLSMFHRGATRVLCDSTDIGLVVTGGGIIGFWDGHARQFKAIAQGEEQLLSDLRPADAQAGAGLLAFVDGNGRLKCYEGGRVHRVLDEPPSGYWVKDSLLLYLDRGKLMRFQRGATTMVENYVPEQWNVQGALLAYLDINRELHGLLGDDRFRFGSEASIPRFGLFGDAVVYPSPLGNWVVATRRRTYVY